MRAHRIGIVGYGKIAQDQHVPVIKGGDAFVLVAVSSTRGAGPPGLNRIFRDHRDMLAMTDLDAVAICTPPNVRHAIARDALAAGKHVMLEKPPAATLSELEDLGRRASEADLTLFTTWHSQANAGVDEARRLLQGQRVRRLAVTWREDVRRWHPGQAWIWEPGGLGVFDPAVNALSIATRILPRPFFLREGVLRFPENRQAPVAADLVFADVEGVRIDVGLDWLQTGPQTWDIRVETDGGTLLLRLGGSRMEVDGEVVCEAPEREYAGLYERFARLVAESRSDVDVSPLRHVADAFLSSRREIVEPFLD
jgi:D-galactose 1-dehydrogenase